MSFSDSFQNRVEAHRLSEVRSELLVNFANIPFFEIRTFLVDDLLDIAVDVLEDFRPIIVLEGAEVDA